jgi:hypothetical protein
VMAQEFEFYITRRRGIEQCLELTRVAN